MKQICENCNNCKKTGVLEHRCTIRQITIDNYKIDSCLLFNESNRLEGVVIQKPADDEDNLRERISQILIAQPTDCRNETNILADRIIEEEIKPLMIHENGEGYAEGIGQTLEATKRTEKMLLDECCEALGRQGGTIHQIKQILIKAKKAKLAYETMRMPQANGQDEEAFRIAMVELIYVFQQ